MNTTKRLTLVFFLIGLVFGGVLHFQDDHGSGGGSVLSDNFVDPASPFGNGPGLLVIASCL